MSAPSAPNTGARHAEDVTGPWSEEDLLRLDALWSVVPKISTAKIGDMLGRTKNAVVGKAHYLKLPGRPSPIRPAGSGKPRGRTGNPCGRPLSTTPDQRQRVILLHEAGRKVVDISRSIGIGVDTVGRILGIKRIHAVALRPAQPNPILAVERQPPVVVPMVAADPPPSPPPAPPIILPQTSPPPSLPPPPTPTPQPVALVPPPPPPPPPAPAAKAAPCLYPVNGPRASSGRPTYRECGDPIVLGSYCEDHALLCYSRIRKRADLYQAA